MNATAKTKPAMHVAFGRIGLRATIAPAMKMRDPLQQAAEAHREALAAREAMSAASARRGAAIRAALAAGHTAPELAEALGVKRERIYAMAKQ